MTGAPRGGNTPHGASDAVASATDAISGAATRAILWGEMGSGKSTLACSLGIALAQRDGSCYLLGLDPGSPHLGPPGAVTAAIWDGSDPRLLAVEALCTLDAVRFRLPLLTAAQRLADALPRDTGAATVLVDPPGVTRGVAGEELLTALVETLGIAVVIALVRNPGEVPLASVLSQLPVTVVQLPASPRAARPPPAERAKRRTHSWQGHLRGAVEQTFDLGEVAFSGTPPPNDVPQAWPGHQIALLDQQGKTLCMGEVVRLDGRDLTLRIPHHPPTAAPRMLIRDAARNSGGHLVTVPASTPRRPPAGEDRPADMMRPPPSGPHSPPVTSRVGWVWATLIGGVFGDPLLHVRLRHRKRSLLFDLGDADRLPARLAHQVTDLFLSHAHLDHVGGFPWFLRSRLGPFPACRVFGPPGVIEQIGHFLAAITWDRIGDNGATFEVAEIHEGRLLRTRLQPGKSRIELPDRPIEGGVVLAEPEFTVCAALCDHGTPAAAYALTTRQELNVRRERLAAGGLPPGPWLASLKHALWRNAPRTLIPLPDGTEQSAGSLAEDLILVRPGKKLAYAADAADTPENRARLIALARGAHTFFCEAAFSVADRARADATQHLTGHAAAEIAVAAGVGSLAPFHFSRRYEQDPDTLWAEIRSAAGALPLVGAPPRL